MSFEKLQEMIADLLDVDKEEVTPEASFQDDLGADSIDIVELHMALEDETGLSIPDEQLLTFKKVQDVYDFIRANA